MSNGLNRVMLIGNLGQDPDLKYTQSGQAVLNLSIATTEHYYDRNKEKKERTDWHRVTIWGKRGESLAQFLSKGTRIFVEGRLQTRSWEANDGSKRYTTEVVAINAFTLSPGGEPRNESQRDTSQNDDGLLIDNDDDIPF